MNAATTPPRDLLERFTPADHARIELVRANGDIRLWKSTTLRTLDDGTELARVRFHVSEGCSTFAFFVSDLDEATAHFDYAEANQFVQSADDSRFFYNKSLGAIA